MAEITLYHAAPSRSSIARWMLEEIGEPYDIKLVSLSKEENRAPAYLAINPMGKVPALRHGDVVITEAAAICTYLADEFPRAKLNVPVGDARRGPYLKWLFFGPSCIEPAMMDRAFPRKEEARRAALGYGDFEDLSVGMTETLSKTISSSDVVGFAQLTGDRNPIHLSEHFAARTSFGRRIAHGLYPASLISAVLGTRLPGPGAVYISQTLNFRAPVKIGDPVDVTVTGEELIPERPRPRLACTCMVAGEIVLDGEALVKVPSASKSKRPLPKL